MLTKLSYDLFSYLVLKGHIRGKDLKSLSLTCKTFHEFLNRDDQSLFRKLLEKTGFVPSEFQPSPRKFYFLLSNERVLFRRFSSKLMAICQACTAIDETVEDDYGGMDNLMHYPLDLYHLLYFGMPDEFGFCNCRPFEMSLESQKTLEAMKAIANISDSCGFGLSGHVFNAETICTDSDRNFNQMIAESYQILSEDNPEFMSLNELEDRIRNIHIYFRNHLREMDFSNLPDLIMENFQNRRNGYLNDIEFFENNGVLWIEDLARIVINLKKTRIDKIDVYFLIGVHQKVIDGRLRLNDPFLLEIFTE